MWIKGPQFHQDTWPEGNGDIVLIYKFEAIVKFTLGKDKTQLTLSNRISDSYLGLMLEVT